MSYLLITGVSVTNGKEICKETKEEMKVKIDPCPYCKTTKSGPCCKAFATLVSHLNKHIYIWPRLVLDEKGTSFIHNGREMI